MAAGRGDTGGFTVAARAMLSRGDDAADTIGSDAAAAADSLPDERAPAPFVVTLASARSRRAVPLAVNPRAVPDVKGMPLRGAVRVLHEAGFRVQLASGPTGVTWPQPGTMMRPGTLVRLFQ
jgi:hypothetical protein